MPPGAEGGGGTPARGDRELRRMLGPSSCIFPIAPEAQHQLPSGSRAAIGPLHGDYLKERPDDLGVRWLLNVAAMTLGEYPDGVPKEFLIPLDRFRSPVTMRPIRQRRGRGRARHARGEHGRRERLRRLHRRRPARRLLQLVRLGPGRGPVREQGRRPFEEPVARGRAGRPGHVAELQPRRLRQRRQPRRPDPPRRLGRPRAAVPAAQQGGRNVRGRDARRGPRRADRVAVGRLGRLRQRRQARPLRRRRVPSGPDPGPAATSCRLYHNNGDGTFTDVADKAGVGNERWAKGAAWGDYDDDGWLDLYVSNMRARNRLYHNNGDGTFTDVAADLGVAEPILQLLLLVLGLRQRRPARPVRLRLLRPPQRHRRRLTSASRPRRSGRGSTTTWAAAGSSDVDRGGRPGPRRSCRWARTSRDIDNDGFLDMYLGTGQPVLHDPRAQPDAQERRGPAVRGRDRRRPAPGTCRRGMASRSPTGTATATSTCSSRSAARRPATRATTSCSRTPASRPPLAGGQARRHADQPRRDRGQGPGRADGARRTTPLRLPHRRQPARASAATAWWSTSGSTRRRKSRR